MVERSWVWRLSGLGGALASVAAAWGVMALTAGWSVGCSSSQERAADSAARASSAGVAGEPAHAVGGADVVGGSEVRVRAVEPSAAPTAASEEVRLTPDESQPPLPDGTFTGRFQGDEAAVSVRLVVRDGMVLVAHVEVVGKRRTGLDLRPMVSADARTLRFQGRFGADYLRLEGRFVDDRRAAGRFEGQVDRKRVSGRWYALRR